MEKKCDGIHVGLMNFLRFIAFAFPLVIYLILITVVFPAPNSGFIAMGVFGCLVLGLGFINLVGMIDRMYLGNIITVILITAGSLLLLVSSVVMYTPEIYGKLNEDHISFYFIVWSLLALSGIYYPFYRHAIALKLQNEGLSKTNIKKT